MRSDCLDPALAWEPSMAPSFTDQSPGRPSQPSRVLPSKRLMKPSASGLGASAPRDASVKVSARSAMREKRLSMEVLRCEELLLLVALGEYGPHSDRN